MRLAGKRKRIEFLEKAKVWFADAPSSMFFGDVKTIAIRAVAEYIANTEDLTLFKLKK